MTDAKILIRSRAGAVAWATVDPECLGFLRCYRWCLNGDGYPRTAYGNPQRFISMHRMLMIPPAGLTVDHINGDKLDNRRCNLRVCTDRENNLNRPKQSNNRSGYKGVYLDRGRWRAQISLHGVRRRLGYYPTAEKAHAAYAEACAQLHREFACVA